MPDPSVSVIIPVYNQERYLADSIQSVLDQDYPNVEIIVVDDGSTDQSAEIARRFDEVRLVQQPNKGHGAALNTGISQAEGDLLGFLDGDDKWEPNRLAVRVSKFSEDADLCMSHGMMIEFVSPELEAAGMTFARADGTPVRGFVIGTTLVRTPIARRIGLFDEELVLGSVMDWLQRARELDLKTFFHEEVLLHRRVHDDNTTSRESGSVQDYAKLVKRMLDRKRQMGKLE